MLCPFLIPVPAIAKQAVATVSNDKTAKSKNQTVEQQQLGQTSGSSERGLLKRESGAPMEEKHFVDRDAKEPLKKREETLKHDGRLECQCIALK